MPSGREEVRVYEQAYLDAIAGSREDDTPHLVYADWLEERGDPARAEFIRLECRLAKLPPDDESRGLGWVPDAGM